MSKRFDSRICIVVGGGQTPGLTIGNGKATALRFAQEGATVIVADRHLDSVSETVQAIEAAGTRGSRCAWTSPTRRLCSNSSPVAWRGMGASTCCTTTSASPRKVATPRSTASPRKYSTASTRSTCEVWP